MFFKYLSTIIPRFFKKWELLDIRGGRLFRTQIFQSVVCVFQICILSLTQQKCNSLGSSGGQTCHPFFDLWGSQDIAFVSATQFILYILVPIHTYVCILVHGGWKLERSKGISKEWYTIYQMYDWCNVSLLPPYLPLHVHVWYFVCLEYEVCQKMDFLWCSETMY